MAFGRKGAPVKKTIPEANSAAGIKINNLSVVGFERTELPNPDNDYSYERQRAKTKMTPEGLKPLTKEEQNEEQLLTIALFKKYAQNILCASSFISIPVAFSEHRSYLERTADLFAFLVNEYIEKSIKISDPNLKLAMITVGIIAGFHLDLNPKKVFNPYLGETYMSCWANGTTIYAEQISHHPPLSVFQINSADGSWYCYSDPVKVDVDHNMMSSFEIIMKGLFHLHIKNGPVYEWEFPTVYIDRQSKGDRIVRVKGSIEVIYVINGYISKVEISPKASKKKNIAESRSSLIYGGISKCSIKRKVWFSKVI